MRLFAPTLAMLALATGVHAQTPTAEQLRAFQNLPKEQRDALLQQMGVGGGAGAARRNAPGGNEIVVTQPGSTAVGQNGRAAMPQPEFGREEVKSRIKGGELILVELVLPATGGTQTITETTPDGRQIIRQTAPTGEATRTPQDQRRLTEFRDRILKRNPYEVSAEGVLRLPGVEPIPLSGLTSDEVQERLAVDPMLRDFNVAVTVLRVEPRGARALKPFGYDMFRGTPTAFVPGTDIPAPDDYVIGPGDVVDLELYGQESQTYSMPVGRDGTISIPDLGPLSVGGLTFGAARGLLESRVKRDLIGTRARVSLSDLRSVRVLVLGDAERPGSYVVSSLSTVTNALFSSGGVESIGSLRRIEVKRDGRLVRRLDLYDVLLAGDTSNDVRLQTGDVVFIPPIGPTVAIDGEVRRPAIYELLDESSVGDLVELAGGLTPTADRRLVTVERIGETGDRRVFNVDLSTPEGRAQPLRSGDLLRIGAIRPVVDNAIRVDGHVFRPGTYAFRDGVRLSDVLPSADELRPGADLGYVLVRREDRATRKVTAFSADLAGALANRGSAVDIELAPRDQITVFDLISPRDRVVDPLLEEMRRQSRPDEPTSLVSVGGRVNAPGRYPLEPGMRVSDLIRAGGGLEDAAYSATAELTRYYLVQGERRRAELMEVDLGALLRGDRAADIELAPYDVLTVKEMPDWGRVEQVEVAGEVRFPGRYQIRRGETLKSVIDRAGGLTPLAFGEGAVFTREELREKERQEIDRLASRLQSDVAVLSLQASQTNPGASQALTAGQSLLEQLRQAKPVGRLVIDLPRIVDSKTPGDSDVMLRNGDRLLVPRLSQEVSVLGEVQNATSYMYRPGSTRDDYVALSGGPTAKGDRKRMYVVRADGSVVGSTSRWFGSGDIDMRPGDTVVVPLDAERMRPLTLWTAVTQIIYNLAIAAAAVDSFGS